MGEDKDRDKHKNRSQLRCISHMEMLHVLLKYPEVVTNLDFIKVSILPLYIWGGIKVDYDTETEDVAYVIAAVEYFGGLLGIY